MKRENDHSQLLFPIILITATCTLILVYFLIIMAQWLAEIYIIARNQGKQIDFANFAATAIAALAAIGSLLVSLISIRMNKAAERHLAELNTRIDNLERRVNDCPQRR